MCELRRNESGHNQLQFVRSAVEARSPVTQMADRDAPHHNTNSKLSTAPERAVRSTKSCHVPTRFFKWEGSTPRQTNTTTPACQATVRPRSCSDTVHARTRHVSPSPTTRGSTEHTPYENVQHETAHVGNESSNSSSTRHLAERREELPDNDCRFVTLARAREQRKGDGLAGTREQIM